MIRSINKLLFKTMAYKPMFCSVRKESVNFEYDLEKEIVITQSLNVCMIGINIPDSDNMLNDEHLKTINQSLKDFDSNDEYSVAVLHGIGGNFCKGLQESTNIQYAEDLIKTLNGLKKPTIASISGYSILFGFQLALMCDIRVMEDTAVLGLGHRKKKDKLFPLVCEKLIKTTNSGTALDVSLTGAPYNHDEAATLRLINRVVSCGTGLGKSINMARSISKYPLDEIMNIKNLVLTLVQNTKTS